MIFSVPSMVVFFAMSVGGSILSLSSSDILFLWLSMELSSLGFIGILGGDLIVGGGSESMAKYFVPMVSSSMLFFVSAVMSKGSGWLLFEVLAVIPLLVKMGVAPFHFWVANSVKGMGWFSIFVMLSVQKLGPLHGLVWGGPLGGTFLWLGVFSAFSGGLGGLGQSNIKKILGYSSISMGGWLLCCGSLDSWLGYIGWGLYSLNLFGVYFCSGEGLGVGSTSLGFYLSLVFLGGFPGGGVFTLKWLALSALLSNGCVVPGFVLSVSSVVVLPMYVGVVFSSLLHYHWNSGLEVCGGRSWILVVLWFLYYWVWMLV